jgi:hypothetical protein
MSCFTARLPRLDRDGTSKKDKLGAALATPAQIVYLQRMCAAPHRWKGSQSLTGWP